MRRVKLISFFLSLIPAFSLMTMTFWVGQIPSSVISACYASYLLCYIGALTLFIIGRRFIQILISLR